MFISKIAKYGGKFREGLNNAARWSGIIGLTVSLYCMINEFADEYAERAETTVVLPAIAEAMQFQNGVDTLKSGDNVPNDWSRDQFAHALIERYIYSEYDPTVRQVFNSDGSPKVDSDGNFIYEKVRTAEANTNDATTEATWTDPATGTVYEGRQGTDFVGVDNQEYNNITTQLKKSSIYNAQPLRYEAGESFGYYSAGDEAFQNAKMLSTFTQGPQNLVGGFLYSLGNIMDLGIVSAAACSVVGQITITLISTALTGLLTVGTAGTGTIAQTLAILAITVALGFVINWIANLEPGIDTSHPETAAVASSYGQQFEYARQAQVSGGEKLSNEEYVAQVKEHKEFLAWQYDQKSWQEKILDGTDYRSVVSTVARAVNINPSSASIWNGLRNVGVVALSMPQIFARIFSPSYILDPVHADNVYDYGIGHYGMSRETQDKINNNPSYDFDVNAEHVFDMMDAGGDRAKKMQSMLYMCYGATMKVDDGSYAIDYVQIGQKSFIESTVSVLIGDYKQRRYYANSDPSSAQYNTEFEQCDSNTDEDWLRIRTYMLDYALFGNTEELSGII